MNPSPRPSPRKIAARLRGEGDGTAREWLEKAEGTWSLTFRNNREE